MSLDDGPCGVAGCTFHFPRFREITTVEDRNLQIVEDWKTGEWSVSELSSFWGLRSTTVARIVREAKDSRESSSSLEVSDRS